MATLAGAAVSLTYAEAAWVLTRAGVPYLALKGPVTASILSSADRLSVDADLLVPPDHFQMGLKALRERGWLPVHAGTHEQETSDHSVTLQRAQGSAVRIELDLHSYFPGFAISSDAAWRALAADSVWMEVAHTRVRAPSDAAATLLIVLHAARSAGAGKTSRDLARALDWVPFETWLSAARLACDSGADHAMAAGLNLTPQGRIMCAALNLSRPNFEWQLRSRGGGGPALFLLALYQAPWRRKLKLIGRELWPTVAFMRIDWLKPDDSGAVALMRAHLRRWHWLAGRLASTAQTILRAKRAVSGGARSSH